MIKCDTKGLDAHTLSLIPQGILESFQRVTAEVLALPHTNESGVERVLNRWKDFDSVSWGPNLEEKNELQEVFDFWTGKSSLERYLFLNRT